MTTDRDHDLISDGAKSMSMPTTRKGDSDLLMDVLHYSEVLKELRGEALTSEELVQHLDVSSSTIYRYTNQLEEMDFVEESDGEIRLTPVGQTIASEIVTLESAVTQALPSIDGSREGLLELVRHSPGLQALSRRPLYRRELEDHLGVSNSTGYRITRALENKSLIDKANGRYAITPTGMEVLEAVSEFEANVRTPVRLGPVLEVIRETGPEVDLDAFADATVTDMQGYTFNPQIRCLKLLEETETDRSIAGDSIVSGYFIDIQERLAEGMELEEIQTPETTAKQLSKYPERAIDVCNRNNVSLYLHHDIRFCLGIYDHRICVGVLDPETGMCRTLVDTDSQAARTWAEQVYESYKADAVHLPRLSPTSLEQTVEKMSGGETQHVEHQ